MSTLNTIHTAISKLNTALIPFRSMEDVKIQVVHNNDTTSPKIVVYCPKIKFAYIPKKVDGFQVIFRDWDGDGTPWMEEFFEDLIADLNFMAGWY